MTFDPDVDALLAAQARALKAVRALRESIITGPAYIDRAAVIELTHAYDKALDSTMAIVETALTVIKRSIQ